MTLAGIPTTMSSEMRGGTWRCQCAPHFVRPPVRCITRYPSYFLSRLAILSPRSNVAAYVGHGFGVCSQLPGQEDHYQNNTLVMTSSGDYGKGTCPPHDAYVVTSGNKVYTQDGKVSECGMSLEDFQAKGYDHGTTAGVWPEDQELATAVRAALYADTGMP